MRQFLRRISPKRAIVDFADTWRQPTPHRWPILGVALASTFFLFMLFVPENQRVEPKPPEVIYITTWDETRTEAEIIASNCANQRLKDELQAKLDQRAELRRDIYKALGRATFIDVDAMEAEAEREREANASAANAPTDAAEAAATIEEYCARAAG